MAVYLDEFKLCLIAVKSSGHEVETINLSMPLVCLPWSLSDILEEFSLDGSLLDTRSFFLKCASSAAFLFDNVQPSTTTEG
jgi:hypothetical protein